jgi:hypothetical protein
LLLEGAFGYALDKDRANQSAADIVSHGSEGVSAVAGVASAAALLEPGPFGELALVGAGLGAEALSSAIGSQKKYNAMAQVIGQAFAHVQHVDDPGVQMRFHLFAFPQGGYLSGPVSKGYFGITLEDSQGNVLINVNEWDKDILTKLGSDLLLDASTFESFLKWVQENQEWFDDYFSHYYEDYFARHPQEDAED